MFVGLFSPGFQLIIEAAVLPEHHEVGLLIAPGQLVLHRPVVLSRQRVVVSTIHDSTSLVSVASSYWLFACQVTIYLFFPSKFSKVYCYHTKLCQYFNPSFKQFGSQMRGHVSSSKIPISLQHSIFYVWPLVNSQRDNSNKWSNKGHVGELILLVPMYM